MLNCLTISVFMVGVNIKAYYVFMLILTGHHWRRQNMSPSPLLWLYQSSLVLLDGDMARLGAGRGTTHGVNHCPDCKQVSRPSADHGPLSRRQTAVSGTSCVIKALLSFLNDFDQSSGDLDWRDLLLRYIDLLSLPLTYSDLRLWSHPFILGWRWS